jgi:hypothetical protein
VSQLPYQFTLAEARDILNWTLSNHALAHQLRGQGYRTAKRLHDDALRNVWFHPDPTGATCDCRCHTGTCGANDMDMAERAIRLIERLRPISADMVQAIVDLVDRAGVDHARKALGIGGLDDDMPL